MGIEGRGIAVYVGSIQIKLGAGELAVKCLFSEKDTTPFLIGRMGIFDHFNINFDNKHKKVIFTTLK